MYVIAGLGNPGKAYELTRHNIGWNILTALAEINQVSWQRQPNVEGEVAKTDSAYLFKPTTFMNNSGSAVKKILQFYQIPTSNLIVLHDELDLSPGIIKLQYNRSSAGHNGVQSIIQHLGTKEFYRIRVGIGRPQYGETADYVLNKYSNEEKKIFEQLIPEIIKWIDSVISPTSTRNSATHP